jgi:3-carboxy-cis,cis-muconate cycloisomerase
MLELGRTIGRQHAQDVVYEAPQASASQGKSFPELLACDPRVTAHLSRSAIDSFLDPISANLLIDALTRLTAGAPP